MIKGSIHQEDLTKHVHLTTEYQNIGSKNMKNYTSVIVESFGFHFNM